LHFLLGPARPDPEERAGLLVGRPQDVPRLLDAARARGRAGGVFVKRRCASTRAGCRWWPRGRAGLGERVAAARAAAAAMVAFDHD